MPRPIVSGLVYWLIVVLLVVVLPHPALKFVAGILSLVVWKAIVENRAYRRKEEAEKVVKLLQENARYIQKN